MYPFAHVSSMNHQSTTLISSMENSTEPNNALNLDFEPFPEPPLSSNMINVSQFIQHTHTYSHRDRAIGIERVKDPALGRTMENYRPTHRTQANTNTTAPCLLLEIFLRLEWRNRRKNGSKGFGRDSSRPVRGSGSADEDENDSDVTRELRICPLFLGRGGRSLLTLKECKGGQKKKKISKNIVNISWNFDFLKKVLSCCIFSLW